MTDETLPGGTDAFATALTRLECEVRAASFYASRSAAVQPHFERWADTLKNTARYADGSWLTSDDPDAQLVRRIEALRDRQTGPKMLDAIEAGRRLNLLKPNGKPRDSLYSTISKAGGSLIAGKWMIAEDRLADYLRGNA